MLLELSIQRIALIESLHLRFHRGMTVFTGETGAGKSIILDSIGLLLGGRASTDLIRSGCDDARVEALFSLPEHVRQRANAWLQEWGMDVAEPDIVVTREVYRNGRTVCRINGRMATVSMLRQFGTVMVQQHGQHEYHGLSKPEEQLRALDMFGRHDNLLKEVGAAYREWVSKQRELQQLRLDEQERVRRLDMLNFQIEEIQRAHLVLGEEEELREQRRRLQHADKIMAAIRAAVETLNGGSRQPGVLAQLAAAQEQVAAASSYESALSEPSNLLDTAVVHAEEALRTLTRQLDGFDIDPVSLERIEDRVQVIRSLERKYGPTVQAVLDFERQAIEDRDRLLDSESVAEALDGEVKRALATLEAATARLHQHRTEVAAVMATDVERVLRTLSMPNARFEIVVRPRLDSHGHTSYSESGGDYVEYMFTANKGEGVKPLAKIASGGELSRTLLAIKAVMADVDDLDTLIFDEIDSGVSGGAAAAIADTLKRLGARRQVLCITHSAQIAAAAQDQLLIRKLEDGERAVTSVESLTDAARIDEIARLLGADVAGETAIEHARALIRQSVST